MAPLKTLWLFGEPAIGLKSHRVYPISYSTQHLQPELPATQHTDELFVTRLNCPSTNIVIDRETLPIAKNRREVRVDVIDGIETDNETFTLLETSSKCLGG